MPVGEAIYAIDAFPDDDLLWRIEWIGGIRYNTSVPLIDVEPCAVNDHKESLPPTNGSTWREADCDRHHILSSARKKCLLLLTFPTAYDTTRFF